MKTLGKVTVAVCLAAILGGVSAAVGESSFAAHLVAFNENLEVFGDLSRRPTYYIFNPQPLEDALSNMYNAFKEMVKVCEADVEAEVLTGCALILGACELCLEGIKSVDTCLVKAGTDLMNMGTEQLEETAQRLQ